jgi:hypothetical protein
MTVEISQPRSSSNLVTILGGLGAIAVLVGALVPFFVHHHESIQAHHLKHAIYILGGSFLGLALAQVFPGDRPDREQALWLLPAILAPLVQMFLMYPSLYDWMMAHPPVHFLQHLAIGLMPTLATFAGQRYTQGIGWIVGAIAVAMAFGAAFGYGVLAHPILSS